MGALEELKAVAAEGARKAHKTEKMRAILDAALASPSLEHTGPLLDYCAFLFRLSLAVDVFCR